MSDRKKGILCIIAAAFFFSLMTVFIRLAGDLPTMEKAFFRNVVAVIAAWVIIIRDNEKLDIIKTEWKDLLFRSLGGTVGIICNFYAVDHLNISDANLLNKLSPFFAILMSIFILKEKPRKMDWLAVLVAFIGAVLVIKPGTSLVNPASFVGLLGGFAAGMAYTFVRRMGGHGVKGPIIVMFFSTFSTLVTIPFMIAEYKPMSFIQLVFMILAGLAAMGGQLTITAAYTFAPAKEISVYDYTQVLFAAVWGYFLFDQIPDAFSFAGYVIILGAVLLRYFYNKKT